MDLIQLFSRHDEDMAGMDMSGSTNTSSASADSGMDMDMGMGMSACKISMLWNWNTVDSCFLSSSWHVKSKGAFAGSVIGVFLLVIAIEAVRRLAREYDRKIVRSALAVAAAAAASEGTQTPTPSHEGDNSKILTNVEGQCAPPFKFTPSWPQQLIRAFGYGTQFTASFLVMLLGMYYNGYILFAIFIGHTVGYFAFARDTAGSINDHTGSGHCC